MILIDTFMVIRRCYARMDFLKNEKGVPTGMEFGTLRIAESLQKKYPGQEIVFCLDSKKSWRKEKYPFYKADREKKQRENFKGSDEQYKETQSAYYKRLGIFLRFLREAYVTAEAVCFEADDIMHALSRPDESRPWYPDEHHYIYTNDHDLHQSVSDNVTVLRSFKSIIYTWDMRKVEMTYGVPPKYLAEFFAFVGDKVDNIPGVPRIRRSFLAKLINWCHDRGLAQGQMLREIASAEWPPVMKEDVKYHIYSDQWSKNYDLISLRNVVPGLKVGQPKDSEFVREKLQEWSIYSLNISKRFGVQRDLSNEEF